MLRLRVHDYCGITMLLTETARYFSTLQDEPYINDFSIKERLDFKVNIGLGRSKEKHEMSRDCGLLLIRRADGLTGAICMCMRERGRNWGSSLQQEHNKYVDVKF